MIKEPLAKVLWARKTYSPHELPSLCGVLCNLTEVSNVGQPSDLLGLGRRGLQPQSEAGRFDLFSKSRVADIVFAQCLAWHLCGLSSIQEAEDI